MKKIVLALALLAGIAAAGPARAMCTPGYVGVDKDTKKVTIVLPRCETHPQ